MRRIIWATTGLMLAIVPPASGQSTILASGRALAVAGVSAPPQAHSGTQAPAGRRLTLEEAEAEAVQNHPQVRAGQYGALAAGEAVREIRSMFKPTVFGSLTGAEAMDGTRIAAGGLNNPTILNRMAYGVSATQMLTDFGRTSALASSAALRADSLQQDVSVRRADVRLAVDRAYFDGLRAQAVLRVAEKT